MGPFGDQVVWITGGGTGLGRHLALELARQGARVVVSGRRLAPLVEVASQIEGLPLLCDVTDEASVDAAVRTIDERYGRLDVVVANAGVSVDGPIERITAAEWRRQLDINVVGAALTIARAIPHLRKTRGRAALIGSVSALVHFAGAGPYQVSKAAVAALGSTLTIELARDGISCTTIHPGFVESDIYKVDNDGTVHPERRDPRPRWLVTDPDRAARVMARAILRRRRELVFTGHGRIGWFLGRHFPGLVQRITSRIR